MPRAARRSISFHAQTRRWAELEARRQRQGALSPDAQREHQRLTRILEHRAEFR